MIRWFNIIRIMREKRLLPPAPVIVADTNWMNQVFAFMVSPISQQMSLWRLDPYGIYGTPMTDWGCWLNGSRHDPQWGLCVNPTQYYHNVVSTSSWLYAQAQVSSPTLRLH